MSEDLKTEEKVEKTEPTQEEASSTPTETAEEGAEAQLSLEDSMNLLVNLARQAKLNYQEHQTVDRAVITVVDALNKDQK